MSVRNGRKNDLTRFYCLIRLLYTDFCPQGVLQLFRVHKVFPTVQTLNSQIQTQCARRWAQVSEFIDEGFYMSARLVTVAATAGLCGVTGRNECLCEARPRRSKSRGVTGYRGEPGFPNLGK